MTEIKLTDHIRNTIRTIRITNKKSGKEICAALNKHPSFISHIENDVVKTIPINDLKNILRYILNISDNELDKYINNLIDYSTNSVQQNQTKKTGSYNDPDYQKEYEEMQDELLEKLKDVVDMIEQDISCFPPEYEDCKDDPLFNFQYKFLTTLTRLILDEEDEITRKFYQLLNLPLHKLNPVQFQKLIDYADSLLEYEYVYESEKDSKTQKYPHHRVKYKNTPKTDNQ